MQTQPAPSPDPGATILNPATDSALRPVQGGTFFWRERPPARILGYPASAHDEVTARIRQHVTYTARQRTFSAPVEFDTIPVELHRAQYLRNFVFAGGKLVLNGASGVRFLNRYLWDDPAGTEAADTRLADWFAACQALDNPRRFARKAGDIAGLPFTIETRNTFNYYHFTTESLCQFCTLDDIGHDRPIILHHPDPPEKTRAFTRAFLQALFPEFADRVEFRRTPQAYDRAVTAFNLMTAYYQYGDARVPSVDRLIPGSDAWAGRRALRRSQGILQMNAVDRNLYRLRERALAAIAGQDFGHLPRRFWVGREAGHARQRTMLGEQALVEALGPLGFVRISFESLSPLEQIALMARAEVMISVHGAGFTNMMFANPAAHVIEIGTLQTARFRWGDFWQLAHVAGCTYTSFFADFARDDPLAEPDFAQDSIVPVNLSPQGIDTVVAHVAALLGQVPRLDDPAQVLQLATRLGAIGAHDRVVALFAQHPGIEQGNAPLCIALAEALHATGAFDRELDTLRAAHLADPSRAFTLVQMIWRAQKAGRAQDLGWAADRMRALFPDRLDELLRTRPHLRRLVG